MPLFSSERSDRNEHGVLPYYTSFTINTNNVGIDTYYPVAYQRLNFESEARIDQVHIFRTFAATGPSNHGTHKAGLSSYWHGTDGAWDGGPSYWYCNEHLFTYRRTLAAAELWSGSDRRIMFFLRGGGYQYQIRSSCPFSIQIYLTETRTYLRPPPTVQSWYAVPRTEAQIGSSNILPTGTSFGSIYNTGTLTGSQRTT